MRDQQPHARLSARRTLTTCASGFYIALAVGSINAAHQAALPNLQHATNVINVNVKHLGVPPAMHASLCSSHARRSRATASVRLLPQDNHKLHAQLHEHHLPQRLVCRQQLWLVSPALAATTTLHPPSALAHRTLLTQIMPLFPPPLPFPPLSRRLFQRPVGSFDRHPPLCCKAPRQRPQGDPPCSPQPIPALSPPPPLPLSC